MLALRVCFRLGTSRFEVVERRRLSPCKSTIFSPLDVHGRVSVDADYCMCHVSSRTATVEGRNWLPLMATEPGTGVIVTQHSFVAPAWANLDWMWPTVSAFTPRRVQNLCDYYYRFQNYASMSRHTSELLHSNALVF